MAVRSGTMVQGLSGTNCVKRCSGTHVSCILTFNLRNPGFHCHSPRTLYCTRLLGFLFSPWITIHSANLPQPFNSISINFRLQPFRSATVFFRLLAPPTSGHCHLLLADSRVELSSTLANSVFSCSDSLSPIFPGQPITQLSERV